MVQVLHHGKEIYLFFGQYQKYGLIGIFISSILMGIIIYKVCTLAQKNNIKNYQEFLDCLLQSHTIKTITEFIIQTFLLISFYIMVAGFSAYFSQEWQLPNYVGTIIIIG